ncbi:MAG: tetratricopeptide repeat protein [Caldilineaceae bacterium]|nr:tetratricopeptide repeat protein [Caldilineaceae bacterium]
MKETVVTSVAEFQARLQELEADEAGLLYRGQADAVWSVSCSAARRLTQDPSNTIDDQLLSSLLVGYLEFLIAKARMRGFLPPGFSETSPDLELLAQLQHQGAATGLIDFTRQPSVALWVACNEAYERDGAVYVLSRSATEELNNSRDLEKKIQSFFGEGTMWLWEPSARGNRIVAQSSIFVFGVPAIASQRMERFIIRADSKRDILTKLETMYGINEEMLFSDFPGFAVANAARKTFNVNSTVSYWREQVELATNERERARAHFKCGVVYSAIKEFESAVEQNDAAIEINPVYADAYNNRGSAKVGLGRYEEAILDFDEAMRINPEDVAAYSNRGSAKAGLDRHEEAIADYDAAIRINSEYADAYYNRGVSKAGLDRHEEAIVDYDVAIRINPAYAKAYNNRGGVKVCFGRHEEAIMDYDAAIRINSEYADAYYNRGVAKAGLGRREEAIKDYNAAIRINPTIAKAYVNRGAAQTSFGRYEEAIADYDAAISLSPNLAEAYANRGAAQTALGRYEKAVADSNAAIGFNPNLAEAYVNRGTAKRFLRQLAAAREDFKRAQTLLQEQQRTDFLQRIRQELDYLDADEANLTPFQIAPHRSGYVPGVGPDNLKEILFNTDDENFTRKDAT